jgi:hypothetical protein
MRLLVTRDTFTTFSCIGTLEIEGQKFFTLEPPKKDEGKPRAIPLGTYDVTIRWSEKHKRLVPHVENVPGFAEIEIHVGNFPADTEGCLLVGKTKGPHPDFIGGSSLAFNPIFQMLSDAKERGEPTTITYTEHSAIQPPAQGQYSVSG